MAHLALALTLVGLLSGLTQRLLQPFAVASPLWWRSLACLALLGVLSQCLLGARMATSWAAQRGAGSHGGQLGGRLRLRVLAWGGDERELREAPRPNLSIIPHGLELQDVRKGYLTHPDVKVLAEGLPGFQEFLRPGVVLIYIPYALELRVVGKGKVVQHLRELAHDVAVLPNLHPQLREVLVLHTIIVQCHFLF